MGRWRTVRHAPRLRTDRRGVGGLEIIGYDPETDQFKCHFFDSFGNLTLYTLSHIDGSWIWQGARTRCTGRFSTDPSVGV